MGVVYVVWGSTYLAIALVIESMPPLVSLGLRFLVAAALLGTFLAVRQGSAVLRVPGPEIGGAMLVGTLLLGVGIGTVALAERYVPSGVSALIIAAVTLWVVVLRTVTGDRPSRITGLGVLVGMLGLAVLVEAGSQAGGGGAVAGAQRTWWSIAMVLGSGSWALGSFLQPRLRTPSHPAVLTCYEMLAGGLALTLVGLARGERFGGLAQGTGRSWLALLYLVTFGSLLAYSAYVWLLGNAPLSVVTTYAYVNPVVAVLLGWWVLAEPVTLGVVVGGLIILSGVVLVVRGERTPLPS